MDENNRSLTQEKKIFSRIGLALSAILIIGTVLQVIWLLGLPAILGEENWLTASSWGIWLGTFLPLYVVAIPAGVALMGKLPKEAPRENKLSVGNFLVFFVISMFVMYTGNLIGTMLSMLLSGGDAQNTVAVMAMDNNPLKILFMVILAPILEEFVFRKQIIDRTRAYGEKTAAVLSAVTFGLLHQNLFQFFYAFGLGLIFAYLYLRTGRLRYPALLHSIINFMGSVLAPWILNQIDLETLASMDPYAPVNELMSMYLSILPGLLLLLAYALILFGLSIAGLVLLILRIRSLTWEEGSAQLPRGTEARTVYWNAGMVTYILLCLTAIIVSLL